MVLGCVVTREGAIGFLSYVLLLVYESGEFTAFM